MILQTKKLVPVVFLSVFVYISIQTMVANAVPATYYCCKNFIADQGSLLDNFENLNDWKLDGINASYIMADRVNYKEGKQGLKLVAKSGHKVFATRYVDTNLKDAKNFAFDVYVHDKDSLGYIAFYFTSNIRWEKYFYYTVNGANLHNGWNHIIIKKSEMQNKKDEDWNNSMTMFRLTVHPKNNTELDTNVTIDDFRYGVKERAKIIFTFDDGTVGDLEAEPILTANNQKAVSFVVVSWIGSTNFMTLEDLKKLQSKGWDISSHTVTHPNLTAIDNSAMIKELNDSYDWLVENGFQKSAGFLAYPFGYYNDNVITETKKRYMFARIAISEDTQRHISPELGDGLYKLEAIDGRNNTSVQSIKDRINTTINEGQLIILLFHRIVDNNPTEYQYLKSDFKDISDYAKNRNSDIDVITFSDYLVTDTDITTANTTDRNEHKNGLNSDVLPTIDNTKSKELEFVGTSGVLVTIILISYIFHKKR